MGKGVSTKRRPSAKRAALRTRSFACADEDWEAVEDFARRRGLGSTSEAARLLLRSGLRTQRLVEEFAAAQEWQIAQAWADAQAVANGDRTVGSWDRIREAGERARARIRERTAAGRLASGG
ncbi:MAG: hypothetical protein ACRDF0_11890 [Candidatus Limnocylindria bacterium]